MPTQLDYLASSLKQRGMEVDCLDLALSTAFIPRSRMPATAFLRAKQRERIAALTKKVENGGYDMVGLSLRNIDLGLITHSPASYQEHFLADLQGFANALNGLPRSFYLVLGGPAVSIFPHEITQVLHADYGIYGAGEEALPYLINSINSGNAPSRKIIARPFDFQNARFTRGHIDLDAYLSLGVRASLQTKRGCEASCNYCTYPVIEGRRYQLRPVEAVIEEMRSLIDRGFRKFFILDNIINWPSEHAKSILLEIADLNMRLGLDLDLEAMVNPKGIDEEFCRVAEMSGLFSTEQGSPITPEARFRQAMREMRIAQNEDQYPVYSLFSIPRECIAKKPLILNIDSGDEDELKQMGKNFTTIDIKEAAINLSERHIPFAFALLIGGPGSSKKTLINSLKLARKCGAIGVKIYIGMRIYPRTPLAKLTHGKQWQKRSDLIKTVAYPVMLTPEQAFEIAYGYRNDFEVIDFVG